MPTPPRVVFRTRSPRTRVLAGSLAGLMALAGCGSVPGEPAPRLLTTTELRAGIEGIPAAAPSTQDLAARAAALRNRAAGLRVQTGDSVETRRLRQRAQQLAALEH